MLRMSCRLELYISEYCLWWAVKSWDKSEVLASSYLVRKSSAAADKTQIAFLKVLEDLYCYTAAELSEYYALNTWEIHVIACCLTLFSSMIRYYTSWKHKKNSGFLFSGVTKMEH